MRKGEVHLLTDLAIGAVSGIITLSLTGMLYWYVDLFSRDLAIYLVPFCGFLAAISGAIGAYTANSVVRRRFPTNTSPRMIISILGGVLGGLVIFIFIPILSFLFMRWAYIFIN